MRMLTFVVAALGVLVAQAGADEYWIAYEGDDFPENEGWIRIWNPPLAERWIEDGALVIDSRASGATNEWYEWYPEWVNPEPGELFIARWRLRVDEVSIGWRDPTIGLYGDDYWGVGFNLNEDTIESVFEDDMSAHFEPQEFHDFEFRSADMRAYELYIDGFLAIEGSFWLSLSFSRVAWGDGVSGGASLTHWDYFRFGVVPEPGSLLLVILLWAIGAAWRGSGVITPSIGPRSGQQFHRGGQNPVNGN
jgi:hypothetical protein